MDGYMGSTRIVRPNFYHRPVSADGEQERFNHMVETTIANVGKEELIRRNEAWASRKSQLLLSDEVSADDYFIVTVYDTRPSLEDRNQLSEEIYQKSLLMRLGSSEIHMKTSKARRREWMKRAAEKWGAREVKATKTQFVQTHFEHYPYEGSRYPERWEPKGVEVFVTSEGDLMYYDMNFSNPPKMLDLKEAQDSLLVNLSKLG